MRDLLDTLAPTSPLSNLEQKAGKLLKRLGMSIFPNHPDERRTRSPRFLSRSRDTRAYSHGTETQAMNSCPSITIKRFPDGRYLATWGDGTDFDSCAGEDELWRAVQRWASAEPSCLQVEPDRSRAKDPDEQRGSLIERLRTPRQVEAMTSFVEGEPPLLTVDAIKALYQRRRQNGFGRCVIKRGTKTWIDLDELDRWLERRRTTEEDQIRLADIRRIASSR